SAFGHKGRSTVPDGSYYLTVMAMRRTDKRIVAVGVRHDEWAVWILAPNGALEWSSGLPQLDPHTSESDANALVVENDGSLLVSGSYSVPGPDNPSNGSPFGVLAHYPAPNSGKTFSHVPF